MLLFIWCGKDVVKTKNLLRLTLVKLFFIIIQELKTADTQIKADNAAL